MNVFDLTTLLLRTPDRWYNPHKERESDRPVDCAATALKTAGGTLEDKRVLAEVVTGSPGAGVHDIWHWNDAEDRTFDQVHDALAEASRRVREQEAAFATYA